jgi:hypothetical protein
MKGRKERTQSMPGKEIMKEEIQKDVISKY